MSCQSNVNSAPKTSKHFCTFLQSTGGSEEMGVQYNDSRWSICASLRKLRLGGQDAGGRGRWMVLPIA